MEIKKVAVIGAGVMGAGIAAHVTNAGVPVLLLDIVPEGATNRNAVAEGAVSRLLKAQPAAFTHKRNARLVTTGNIEDHLDQLAECDWIVEAVVERLDVKQSLYQRIEAARRPGSVVSSNTSTIPLANLLEGMAETFRRDFLITHFFNPPRYMRLLELVAGPETREEAVAAIRQFGDRSLGKGVVDCKDTPGFIGNRIGIYWLQCGVGEAMRAGLTVEEADAVVGRPMGIPKTGVFGLLDLVGIDLMPHIMASMDATLPADDAFRDYAGTPPLIERMIADGYTGRKGKGGFYRLNREGGKKVKESIDLESGEYSTSVKARLESVSAARGAGLRALVEHEDRGGRYAWSVLSRTLSYAASLVPAIADDVLAVDEAMRLGYNWKYGPFELIDRLGADWLADRLAAEGRPVPPLLEQAREGGFYRETDGQLQYLAVDGGYRDVERPEGVVLLADVKRRSEPLARNPSASLWDVGDGVVCLEFRSKMNSMDPQILDMIHEAVAIIPGRYKALVIYNEGSNFSVGANLGLLMFAANIAGWQEIEGIVRGGQETFRAMKYAPFPVVGAPSGMALGGGCEVLLHCDALQAHVESYVGLVEVGVGLVPGWGGCKELLQRWSTAKRRPNGPMPPAVKAFETISVATVAKSAEEARDYQFLRPEDGITMNRDRLLADAKARALAMAEDYQVPESPPVTLPGPSAKAAMTMAVRNFKLLGKVTPHDEVVADRLSDVLSGGETDLTEELSEDDLLALERNAFMKLVKDKGTLARIEHMLETGRPLRN